MRIKICLVLFLCIFAITGCESSSVEMYNSSSMSISSENNNDNTLSKANEITLQVSSQIKLKPTMISDSIGGDWFTDFDKNIYSIKEAKDGVTVFIGKKKIGEYTYSYKYCEDFLLNNSLYFILSSREVNETMNIELKQINLNTGEEKTVYSAPSNNMYAYIDKISDREIVFFYNGINNERQCQYVMYYNVLSGELKSIYEITASDWNNNDNSTKNIWAMSTDGEQIILLQHQLIGSNMTSFLTRLNKNGDILSDITLTNLSGYNKKEYYIDQITVVGSYVFTKFYSNGDMPPFAMAKLQDNEIVSVNLGEILPCWRLSKKIIDNRYVAFTTYPNNNDFIKNIRSADIYIFDLIDESAKLIKLDVDGVVVQIKCNDKGDFISLVEHEGVLSTYILGREQW